MAASFKIRLGSAELKSGGADRYLSRSGQFHAIPDVFGAAQSPS